MNIKSTVSRIIKTILVLGLIVGLAVSCDDSNISGPEDGKAQMNVHLTDAPGDYQEVNINIEALRIHYTPNSSDTANADSADGEWIDLPVEPMTVNLLELTNGVDTLLTSAELDPGIYKELRLILSDGNTVMVDSATHDLKVPSGQQSGYKIKFNTELEAGEELDVTIDFDAGRSVHKAGKSGMYILKPVLKAFVENGEEVGAITGVVAPADAEPNIFAIMGDDTSATTQSDDEGEFLLEGLEDGEYQLSIEPTAGGYADTTLSDIMVEEGEETDVGTVTLSANE